MKKLQNKFTNTYDSRWDYKENKGEYSLSYYEDENVYYIGNDIENVREIDGDENLDLVIMKYNHYC